MGVAGTVVIFAVTAIVGIVVLFVLKSVLGDVIEEAAEDVRESPGWVSRRPHHRWLRGVATFSFAGCLMAIALCVRSSDGDANQHRVQILAVAGLCLGGLAAATFGLWWWLAGRRSAASGR